eukprot:1735625-Alexandrium_andersonii.AAC.1
MCCRSGRRRKAQATSWRHSVGQRRLTDHRGVWPKPGARSPCRSRLRPTAGRGVLLHLGQQGVEPARPLLADLVGRQ